MLPALIPLLTTVVGAIVDRIPDPNERERKRAEIEAELVKQANALALAQAEQNKVEAAHGSVFVAGWRPFIGWVCGCALAWAFIVQPIAVWAAAIIAPGAQVPGIVTDNLFELVLAMLGLGGLRTFEKLRGVTVNMPGSVQPAQVLTADDLNARSLAAARR